MTTGNLRHFAEAAFNALFQRSDPDTMRRMKLFGTICLWFLAGATLGGLCVSRIYNKALWVNDVVLLFAWRPLVREWRRSHYRQHHRN